MFQEQAVSFAYVTPDLEVISRLEERNRGLMNDTFTNGKVCSSLLSSPLSNGREAILFLEVNSGDLH